MLNCDTKSRGEYARVWRGNRGAMDCITMNDLMHSHYESMKIYEENMLYDFSDQIYIYMHDLAFFYAIDGLLLARSCAEAEDMFGLMVGMAGKYRLNINKGKSYVLLCNHRGIPPKRVR